MNGYRIVTGDATSPDVGNRHCVIPHVCNDVGKWGAGFTGALSAKWPEPEDVFRKADDLQLGQTQFVAVAPHITVANMVAQKGIRGLPLPSVRKRANLRYAALVNCMVEVGEWCDDMSADIHCPMFGSALAGGNWEVIEQLIWELWCDRGINVTVYRLPIEQSPQNGRRLFDPLVGGTSFKNQPV